MNVKKFLIANGNSTALIYDCPAIKRNKVAKKLLNEVEQVGFVSTKYKFPKLVMMGSELCINATLAFASTLNENGKLSLDSLKKPICYTNKKKLTTIRVPFKIKQDKNIILLNGIGFILYNKKEKVEVSKLELSNFCKKYKLPAFGGVIYDKNKIVPYIYVAHVDSFIKETACGSGSVAFSIFSGIADVVQPTSKIINIKKTKSFDITARVTKYL